MFSVVVAFRYIQYRIDRAGAGYLSSLKYKHLLKLEEKIILIVTPTLDDEVLENMRRLVDAAPTISIILACKESAVK